MKNLKRNLILISMLILASLSITKSQNLLYDFELNAEYDSQISKVDLLFTIQQSSNVTYDKFELLIRPGTLKNTIEDITQFKTVIDITSDIFDTTFRNHKDIQFKQYLASIEYEMKEKKEVIIVVATSKSGNKIISTPRQIERIITNQRSIYFISEIKKENLIALNSSFRYEAKAKTNYPNDIITYKILPRQSNTTFKWSDKATVNAETGVFEFKGTEAGAYLFSIEATNKTGNVEYKAVQNIIIIVDECETLPSLTVSLTDIDGKPLRKESLFLVPVEQNDNNNRMFTAETDDHGMALINASKGKYHLIYNGNSNFGIVQYYGANSGSGKPAIIELNECGYQYTVKFEVRTNLDSNNIFDLVFTKFPKESRLSIDQKYTFETKAIHKKDPDAIIEYLLENAPEGMEINSETGLISWTPKAAGNYKVNLYARLANNHYVNTSIFLIFNVSKCAMKSTIELSLFDKVGNPISPNNAGFAKLIANLYFYQGIDNNSDTTHREYYKLMIASTSTVFGSRAYFAVDEGQYLLMINSQNKNIWYKNASDVKNATPIKVECNDTLMLEMVLDVEVESNLKSIVSGYCLDEAGKVIHSEIVFEGTRSNSNGMNMHFRKSVSNNDNGYYSIELPRDYTYIAYAISKDSKRPLYWNNTYNRFDAIPIITEKEKYDNINFVFKTDEQHANKITVKGTVKSTTDISIKDCFVVVLDADETTKPKNNVGTTYLSTDGSFEFNLESGNYIFLAIPQSRNYIPGFYNENGVAEFTWEDATIVLVDANSNKSIDIVLQEIERKPGIARVNGSIKLKHTNTEVENANILLLSADKAVEYTSSNYNGEFDISNIADGDYTLVVNKVGYSKYETNLTLDAQEPINLDITLEAEIVSSVEEFNTKFMNLEVYPNPSSEYIELKNKTSNIYNAYEVYNLKGIKIISGEYNNQKISINTLSPGKYFVKLLNDKNNSVVPFTVTK